MFLPGESELFDLLTRVVAERDFGTGHALRVGCYVRMIMENMGGFSLEDCEQAEMIARIHDIGNANIRDVILHKQGPLTPEELLEVGQHPEVGCEMLGKTFDEFLSMIRHHHEKWDGSGYPDRLARERIPLWARILRVADAFDAMTSWRPYRQNPLTIDQAMQELGAQAGIQFDPKVVSAFAAKPDTVRAIAEWIGDGTLLHHGSRLAIDFNVISGGAALTDVWNDKSAFLDLPENPGVVTMLRELACRYFRGDVYIYPNSSGEWTDHKQEQWFRNRHIFDRIHIRYCSLSLEWYILDVVRACQEWGVTHFIGYDLATVEKLVGTVPNLYLLRQGHQPIPSGSPIKATSSTQELIDWIVQPWPMEIPLSLQSFDPTDLARIAQAVADRPAIAAIVRGRLSAQRERDM